MTKFLIYSGYTVAAFFIVAALIGAVQILTRM